MTTTTNKGHKMTMNRRHEDTGIRYQVTAIAPNGKTIRRTVQGCTVRAMECNGFELVTVEAVPQNKPASTLPGERW